MQTGATLSDLMKLYDYDLFDDIVLPSGVDSTILVNQILLDCGLYEVLYPQHDFLKGQIENFFQAQLFNFTKVYEALSNEYNPLHNYDRYEDRNENKTINENTENNQTLQSTSVNSTNEENKVSAFDSTVYQPSRENTSKDNTNLNSTSNNNGNYTNNEEYITSNHLYGNIGVTTSQQMLESELILRNKWNIYQFISTKFFDTFMVKCL